jgi:hypothetical protein
MGRRLQVTREVVVQDGVHGQQERVDHEHPKDRSAVTPADVAPKDHRNQYILTQLAMRSWTRRRLSVLLGLALLAGLALLLVGESFFHTDDGCPVETHCLTCKWAAGSIAIVTPDLTPTLALEALGLVAPATAGADVQAPGGHAASRGPPQA